MKRDLPIRSIVVNGRRTSVRMGDRHWAALERIARECGTSVTDYLGRIDRERGDEPLSRAIRDAVVRELQQLRDPLEGLADRLLPAVMRDVRATENDTFERKIWLRPEALPGLEPEEVAALWEHWRALRHELGTLPAAEPFCRRVALPARYNVIDVSPESPANFRVLRRVKASIRFADFDLRGRSIGEYPFALHREGMVADFFNAKTSAAPIYQVLRQRFRGLQRTYARLVLPFASDGRSVDRLVSIVRTIEAIRPAA